jgi:predicted nucleic acid-binding protein
MTELIASEKELIDTNVLVYSADVEAGERHLQATSLIRRLAGADRLAVSVQVLNEFYAAVTRQHRPLALSHSEASEVIQELIASATIFPLTLAATLRALDAVPQHGLSFWDALIWAVARQNGVRVIHTEDFQHGRVIEGVQFRNPFAAAQP